MWFTLALVAMFCWSGSDLFSKLGSRPDDKFSHWKMVMAVGLVMGLHAMFEIFVNGVRITFGDIITYLPASLLYIVSMILGYVGLRYIELSISSPICNCSGAVAALFCMIFLGESPEAPEWLLSLGVSQQVGNALCWLPVLAMGAGVLLLGIVDAREDDALKLERRKAGNFRYTRSVLALLLPILYCILDAAGTVADSIILETLNESVANVAYELTFLFMGVCAAVYTFGVKKQKPEVRREVPKLVGGVFETAGQFAYVYALAANTVGAAPIICCYCLVSVIWGRIFLKEKLTWKHYGAIAIAAVGIVTMGLIDP